MAYKQAWKSRIQGQLEYHTGLARRAHDTDLSHRKRLVFAVVKLPDEQWNKLSKEAQKWTNAAVDALNSQEPLPLFPDEEDYIESKKLAAAQSAPNRRNNVLKSKRGASERIKELMLEHGIKTTPVELHRMLREEGFRCSIHTLKIVRAEFRRACQFLWERDLLTEKIKDL